MKLAVTFTLALLSLCVVARERSAAFLDAMRNGATAKIKLRVVDDGSRPVALAKVRVFMGMNFRERGYWIEGETDSNGMFVIEGKTTGNEIEIHLSKNDYYCSFRKLCFIANGAESKVKGGKWQPYGEELDVVLRPIKNPAKLQTVSEIKYKLTEAACKWIGYDLEKSDFVKPYGVGEVSDFEVYLDWDKVFSSDCMNLGFKIRFVEPFSGYYSTTIETDSEFKTPYNAIVDATYLKDASFYDKFGGERIRKTFDKSKCWVIRSRCKVDETGRLIAANYTVARFLGMTGSRELKPGFCFLGAFNPKSNDTNLEDAETARLSRLGYKQQLEYERRRKED